MVMANMNYERKDFQEAINIVTVCIAEIKNRMEPETEAISKKDIADLLFNRAHYSARIYHEGAAELKAKARADMLRDLRESLELSPENIADIDYPSDEDLGDLTKDRELAELYKQFKK